jgi:hypothetical protein
MPQSLARRMASSVPTRPQPAGGNRARPRAVTASGVAAQRRCYDATVGPRRRCDGATKRCNTGSAGAVETGDRIADDEPCRSRAPGRHDGLWPGPCDLPKDGRPVVDYSHAPTQQTARQALDFSNEGQLRPRENADCCVGVLSHSTGYWRREEMPRVATALKVSSTRCNPFCQNVLLSRECVLRTPQKTRVGGDQVVGLLPRVCPHEIFSGT